MAQWTTGRYGGRYLSVGKGLIKASVAWNSCAGRDATHGYEVIIGDRRYKHLFKDEAAAMKAVETRILDLIAQAKTDIENILLTPESD